MNYYAQAITILSKRTDDGQMLFEIAKKNPKAVVDAYARMNPAPLRADWETGAIKLIASGQFIEATKHCRAMTGMTLSDSKDACAGLKALM